MQTYDVVAIGELLIDFAQRGVDKSGYPTLAAHPGGAPGNVLAALAGLDKTTAFLGKVGDDAFGSLLLQTLAGLGIDTRGVRRDPTAFTTMAFVTLDDQGERSFSFARKPGADTRLRFEEIDLDMVDKAKILHFGALSLTDEPARTATKKTVEYALSRNKLISFDPNFRAPLWRDRQEAIAQMQWGLSRARIVKLSGEEAELLFACPPEEGTERLLRDYGVDLAMVTLGSRGAILQNPNGRVTVAAPTVESVDTTGAGDIFTGSALAALLELDRSPEELTREELLRVGRFAVTAASLSTQNPGGMRSMPTREQIQAMLTE